MRLYRALATGNQHAYVVAVQEDSGQLGLAASVVKLGDVLKDHVDVVVKADESSAELALALHDDPYPGADTLVDEFEGEKLGSHCVGRGRGG